MSGITAADIMTRKLVTLSPDTDIYEAMDVLLSHRISGAPVVDDGALVGILSEYDCMTLGGASMTDLYATGGGAVRQYMTSSVHTARPDTPIGDLAATFISRRVRRLPVVDDSGTLVGLVSRRDVLKGLLIAQEERSQSARRYPDYRRPS